ncbi:enoyl-CoA delta isomerase 2, mitochondrial [Agrilus planipennis]|uniref:Enoyl-CoA delta isomerase 2, mitochondrial n=1 Tax=Agrilus planipennis TaxID=224129 RepID=A0A1W4XH69_AGRPL|nr:enoyl-CoA delta isomerase 2, mitochondrial [Agrilus planipennis]
MSINSELPFLTTFRNGVKIVRFNRPEKKNSFSLEFYKTFSNILNEDAQDDDIKVTIITGIGDYFCSGTDLNFDAANIDINNYLEENSSIFKRFVLAFINYPKLLIAVVNGPAIGVGVTILALCDIVYASEKATFQTPFLDLGLCPEACSSYLFPLILGSSKANEMLLLGYKMDAQEAYQFGLISKVIPHSKLNQFIEDLSKYGSIPIGSLKRSKGLIRRIPRGILSEVNDAEVTVVKECIMSEEFYESLARFLGRKNKSKL